MFTQFTSYCNICFFVANKKIQDVTELTINQSMVVCYPTKPGETWIALPEINSSHFRKMDGWKTILSFLGPGGILAGASCFFFQGTSLWPNFRGY